MLKIAPTDRGVALIELLVALVIASLGLLTLVALQAAALRYTQVSQRRAVVTLLAQDFTERLRANATSADALAHYALASTFADQARTLVTPPAQLCNTANATCTINQMAAFDVYEWRRAVRSLLPEGSVLTQFNTAQNSLDIWIAWREPLPYAASGALTRPAAECPAGFQLDANTDTAIRCMTWTVRR